MSKYWTTVKHFKAKPSDVRMEHIWQHKLRYGRHYLAFWTVTDLSPMMVADFQHIANGKLNIIRLIIEGNENTVEVFNPPQPTNSKELGANK